MYFRGNNMSIIDTVILSLLDSNTHETHLSSGLNWGQRKNREPNQAYIPVPAKVVRTGFFPPGGKHFEVLTDDSEYLILRLEQDNDKAITTPENNSILGKYFRNRLGLNTGEFVTREHLEKYGRTDVTFYKTSNGEYLLDFSKPSN
ncbi:hypothetical protein B5S42_12510 [Gilliamella apicola]|nr:hypothetical protein B5S42_12510 [Gilliamella apicola]OTQ11437.1 hypothetical protein B6C87_07535 [Gilliamella apicola]